MNPSASCLQGHLGGVSPPQVPASPGDPLPLRLLLGVGGCHRLCPLKFVCWTLIPKVIVSGGSL